MRELVLLKVCHAPAAVYGGCAMELVRSSVEGNHIWCAESAGLAHSLLLHEIASRNESLLFVLKALLSRSSGLFIFIIFFSFYFLGSV